MRAIAQRTWAKGEPLVELELPTPAPKRGEVRVSVRAVGVNPVDWKMRSLGPLRAAARLIGPPPPVVVGVDFAGVVDAVGEGVTAFSVVVDCVGGYSGARSRALLAKGGRHVLVAGQDVGALLQALVPPFSSKLVLGKPTGARLAPVLDAIARGDVKVNVAHRLPLAEAERAHELSQTERLTGKVVLGP